MKKDPELKLEVGDRVLGDPPMLACAHPGAQAERREVKEAK
jgi:hypothetical protein